MKNKITIGVIFGGKSPEYEISLLSGNEVVRNLNPKKYEVVPIVIAKDGKSLLLNNRKYPLNQLSTVNCQLFFIAMHGPFGEDGTIQGLLEMFGIPYTGSKVLASALGMDKIYSRKIFTQAGLLVPKTIVFKKGDSLTKINKNLRFPLIVKPQNQGSSVGTRKVRDIKELPKALKLALKFTDIALVEEFINGVEITAGILGNEPLPLIEIVPKKDFFDYKAKYNAKLTEEIVPARIDPKLTRKAQQIALKAFKAIGCRGFGRVDMIIKDNNIYVLELNTIPGLTPVSLLPKAAYAAGLSYSQLLDNIISYSR